MTGRSTAQSGRGAVDLSECRSRSKRVCRCGPPCRVCGFGKHMSVHGPVFGCEPGSKPYDHEYEPVE